MPRFLVGLILLSGAVLFCFAEQPGPLQSPAALPLPHSSSTQGPREPTQPSSTQAPTAPDYSQQAFVVEHYRQAARFENDGTGRAELEARIKVMSDARTSGWAQAAAR